MIKKLLAVLLSAIVLTLAGCSVRWQSLAFTAESFKVNGMLSNPTGEPVVIKTKEELLEHCEKYFKKYTGYESAGVDDEYPDFLEKYDSDDFFKNNLLIMISFQEGSGSYSYEAISVRQDGEVILEKHIPQVANCAVARYDVIIQMEKSIAPDQFTVTVIEKKD